MTAPVDVPADRVRGPRPVAPPRFRHLQPVRDRTAAGGAGRRPVRAPGRVRDRVRRRCRLAVERRARGQRHRDGRARPEPGRGRERPVRRRPAGRGASPATGARCATTRPFSLLFLDVRDAKESPGSTRWPSCSDRAASSCSTTSRRARPGRRCTRAGSTRCASSGSLDERFTTVEVMVAPRLRRPDRRPHLSPSALGRRVRAGSSTVRTSTACMTSAISSSTGDGIALSTVRATSAWPPRWSRATCMPAMLMSASPSSPPIAPTIPGRSS